jgi:DNA-binding transcriptional LysR family regulator
MPEITIRQLQVVNAIIKYGSAATAAKSLNISPSAISYTLNKLMSDSGEKLFVRTRQGLKPNEFAFELQSKYNKLTQIKNSQSRFVIATYSLIEQLLGEHIQDTNDASMHFVMMDSCENERLRKIKNREVDIDIGSSLPRDSSIISQHFLHSEICIIANKNHSEIADIFTTDDWIKNKHLIWQRYNQNISDLDRYFDHDLFEDRQVSWTSSNLLLLAWHCSTSNHIMMMPKIFVPAIQKSFPIKAYTLPTELKMRFDCYIHYHKAMRNSVDSLLLGDMAYALGTHLKYSANY